MYAKAKTLGATPEFLLSIENEPKDYRRIERLTEKIELIKSIEKVNPRSGKRMTKTNFKTFDFNLDKIRKFYESLNSPVHVNEYLSWLLREAKQRAAKIESLSPLGKRAVLGKSLHKDFRYVVKSIEAEIEYWKAKCASESEAGEDNLPFTLPQSGTPGWGHKMESTNIPQGRGLKDWFLPNNYLGSGTPELPDYVKEAIRFWEDKLRQADSPHKTQDIGDGFGGFGEWIFPNPYTQDKEKQFLNYAEQTTRFWEEEIKRKDRANRAGSMGARDFDLVHKIAVKKNHEVEVRLALLQILWAKLSSLSTLKRECPIDMIDKLALVGIDARPKLERTESKAEPMSSLPIITKWNELCLSNTSTLSIYISKNGKKGRDYSFVELHLGDNRKNSAARPTKIWKAIRFYAFNEGDRDTFDKNDLARANKALRMLFPGIHGNPLPGGIKVIKKDALDRQTTRYNPNYSGMTEAECKDEAKEMQYGNGYNDEMEHENA